MPGLFERGIMEVEKASELDIGKKITITEEALVTYYYSYSMTLYRRGACLPLPRGNENTL